MERKRCMEKDLGDKTSGSGDRQNRREDKEVRKIMWFRFMAEYLAWITRDMVESVEAGNLIPSPQGS